MTIPVLLALTGSSLEPAVVTGLQDADRAGVHIARRCVDVADLVASAATGRARAALVAADLPHLDADVVARLRAAGVEPMGVVGDDAPEAAHRLHQIGIGVVLPLGSSHDLALRVAQALARDVADEPEPEPPVADDDVPTAPGRVVAVWGPAGAPGRSTVALGLAAVLAADGVPALLVDADVYGGSLAQHLAILDDASGVLAAARNARVGTLDAATLAPHCRRVGELRVLTGLPRPDRWPELSAPATSAILTAARALAHVVVVDCGFSLETDEEVMFDTEAPRRNAATLRVLEEADRTLVVGAADPVGLSRLARAVVDLTAVVPGVDTGVVVNRMRPSLGWSASEAGDLIARFTGRRPRVVLPEDRTACDRALVHGRPLTDCAGSSPLVAGLRDLAAQVAADLEIGGPAGGSGGSTRSARRRRRSGVRLGRRRRARAVS